MTIQELSAKEAKKIERVESWAKLIVPFMGKNLSHKRAATIQSEIAVTMGGDEAAYFFAAFQKTLNALIQSDMKARIAIGRRESAHGSTVRFKKRTY